MFPPTPLVAASLRPVPLNKRRLSDRPDSHAKKQATTNAQYLDAFVRHDRDKNSYIDMAELNLVLQEVQQEVEKSQLSACGDDKWLVACKDVPKRPFNQTTLTLLAGNYVHGGGRSVLAGQSVPEGARISFQQFCEMAQYLECLRDIFCQIDGWQNGCISISKLCDAFFPKKTIPGTPFEQGYFPGGRDAIVRAYDEDGNGVITFDEFVQMRLEWDYYKDAWGCNKSHFANGITSHELVDVLKFIKQRLDFVPDHNPWRILTLSTATELVRTFGSGNGILDQEQFCRTMEWLKGQRKKFTNADKNNSGRLDRQEFFDSNPTMPQQDLHKLFNSYDKDKSGQIEFDEFLQMTLPLKAPII